TGTLTTGKAEVTQVVASETGAQAEERFLSLIAGLEAHSEHPIADAIRRHIDEKGISAAQVRDVETVPSEGITGEDAVGPLWAGNPRMAARMGASLDAPEYAQLTDGSQTVVWLGRGDRVYGALTVADRPRETSAAGLAALRTAGVGTIAMMTGDRRPVGLRIAAELGLEAKDVHADLLPEDKVRLVGELAKNGKVAFVGDGVNDAAAQARADGGGQTRLPTGAGQRPRRLLRRRLGGGRSDRAGQLAVGGGCHLAEAQVDQAIEHRDAERGGLDALRAL